MALGCPAGSAISRAAAALKTITYGQSFAGRVSLGPGMKAVSLVVFALAFFGTAAAVLSIMGSGPCTPPPCAEGQQFCRQTCNGTETFCCKSDGTCGNCAPCSSDECPPAPACSTAVCINPAYCGDSSAERVICCRYDFWELDAPCPRQGNDLNDVTKWTGACNADHQCVEPK